MFVNCVSQEYFGVVDFKVFKLCVIIFVFMEFKGGKFKIVSFFVKKVCGFMVWFMIQNCLMDVEVIKEFDFGGYKFELDMFEGDKWVFLCDYFEIQLLYLFELIDLFVCVIFLGQCGG